MRPEPLTRIDSAFFWEACAEKKLVAQKCNKCNLLWHPPRPMCPKCYTTEQQIETLSGRGKVMSWALQEHPYVYFFEESPIVALIELNEGVRFVSNLENIELDDITVGLEVEVFFVDAENGKAVPVFRPVKGDENNG